jgi:hypothetical protein
MRQLKNFERRALGTQYCRGIVAFGVAKNVTQNATQATVTTLSRHTMLNFAVFNSRIAPASPACKRVERA